MILHIVLEHAKTKERQPQDIWGVDASKIAQLAALPKYPVVDKATGKSRMMNGALESHITSIVRTKLPPAYYNFDVVEWELRDHKPFDGKEEAAA